MMINTYKTKEKQDFTNITKTIFIAGFVVSCSSVKLGLKLKEQFSDGPIVQYDMKSYSTRISPNITLRLSPLNFTAPIKIDDAYKTFCNSSTANDIESIKDVYAFMKRYLSSFAINKVTISADPTIGLLNVAMLLPDNVLLSISKRKESINDPYVAFNLYYKKELLISDIRDISDLNKYILTVQSKTM